MQAAAIPTIMRLAMREHAISELDDIDQLVHAYRARLFRFVVCSLGDQDLAESIVQDCFLKAYAARESFRGDCTVQTWLTGIALNLVRDHQRTQKFRFWRNFRKTALDVTELASTLSSGATSPEARLLAQERAGKVMALLEDLSFNQRTIFLMRFHEEMEIREISSAMHMPANTVKTHLRRAVKAVRERMGGER